MEVNKAILNRVEKDSSLIDEVVQNVVKEYTGSLEEYVDNIKTFLENGADELSITDLNNIALRLSSYLFFLSVNLGKAGVRSAVAEQVYTEKYNTYYNTDAKGTIADKQAQSTENSKEEQVVNIVFDKAYKILKLRYNACDKLVDTVKKVISARLAEMNLTGKTNL